MGTILDQQQPEAGLPTAPAPVPTQATAGEVSA